MMEKIVILLTILIGGGISLVLLMGKGGFLIAGYNTASEKERRKYNEKKLCRTVGAYMALITVLVLGAELLGENIPDWYLALCYGRRFYRADPYSSLCQPGLQDKTGRRDPFGEKTGKRIKKGKDPEHRNRGYCAYHHSCHGIFGSAPFYRRCKSPDPG